MVYVCENCGALFSRAGEQDHCPDCGKQLIRAANQVEQREYASQLAELLRRSCMEGPCFPNTVVTEIFRPESFAFKLPATALQIDSDIVVEVLVEFGENTADSSDLTVNVWARQEDGEIIKFLMPMHLPAKQGEASQKQVRRLFEALSGNRLFTAKLFSFVTEQLSRED